MPLRTEELPSVARRMAAGKMLMEGASASAVAEALHLSPTTIRKYRAILDEGGLEALAGMSVGGRTSVLDHAAIDWIARALSESARAQEYPTDAWTNSRLRDLIETRFGVQYSRVYIWQLANNLGLGHRLSKSRK